MCVSTNLYRYNVLAVYIALLGFLNLCTGSWYACVWALLCYIMVSVFKLLRLYTSLEPLV